MTNYQPVQCYQCKGEKVITVKKWVRRNSFWRIMFTEEPAHIYEDVSYPCGYCKGKGSVAVDVDKLVKIN